MECTCRIERVTNGQYDEDDLIYTAGTRELLYEGPCRLWEVSQASQVQVGETDISMYSTQLSIPWDTQADIRRHDEAVILTSPSDEQVIGKRFEIQSVAKAGQLRATRRFTVSAVQDKK